LLTTSYGVSVIWGIALLNSLSVADMSLVIREKAYVMGDEDVGLSGNGSASWSTGINRKLTPTMPRYGSWD